MSVFDLVMGFGVLLGLLVAIGVGLVGAKGHILASERHAERQRRIDERQRALDKWESREKGSSRNG